MKPIKVFSELLSPASWAVLYAGFIPMFVLVLRPSWSEFGYFVLIDTIALFLMVILPIERRVFQAIWPSSKAYFPAFDPEPYATATTKERIELFDSLIRFPQRRAAYCALVSYLKYLPALSFAVFYWKHDYSVTIQAARILALFTVMCFYFYGALYFEYHARVSEVIATLHQTQDWTEVFMNAHPTYPNMHFDQAHVISVNSIWASMIAALGIITWSSGAVSTQVLVVEVLACSIGAFILCSRLWSLERRYFLGGLQQLFKQLDNFNPQEAQRVLPLHSSPVLARFDTIFNLLMDRLRNNEREISHWIFSVSEQSRFRALGETSGLIVHDLGAPLQVVAFCAEQIVEDPSRAQNPRYVEQLQQNIQRALDLIQSWRAYLKNQKTNEQNAGLDDAFSHVKKLLATQIEPFQYNSVRLEFDAKLKSVSLKIPRAELIHILVNLLSNSFNNLIQNQISDAVITLKQVELDDGAIVLSITDNGTGLKPEVFEQLTAFQFLPRQNERSRGGMGLRLVRRLIEQNGGGLTAVEVPSGTELRLKLILG
jgi:signal transduction histidine kinase